jgi:hypothetical protein
VRAPDRRAAHDRRRGLVTGDTADDPDASDADPGDEW